MQIKENRRLNSKIAEKKLGDKLKALKMSTTI